MQSDKMVRRRPAITIFGVIANPSKMKGTAMQDAHVILFINSYIFLHITYRILGGMVNWIRFL